MNFKLFTPLITFTFEYIEVRLNYMTEDKKKTKNKMKTNILSLSQTSRRAWRHSFLITTKKLPKYFHVFPYP